jgi:UDP-3-O-[3-hydroxymyristoyl] N-acetylglucosamine deacetylase
MNFIKAETRAALGRQRTLKNAIPCRGVALHSGAECAIILKPASPNHGIVFKRTDVADTGVMGKDPLVPARWDRVSNTVLSTTISNADGVQVATIEHLMAAFAGCEIDNVLVEIDGPEVPIMDGSAAPFVMLLECAGVVSQEAPRQALKILQPITVSDGDSGITVLPGPDFSVEFEIDFNSLAITERSLDIRLVNGTFNEAISRARTFGFLEDVDRMRAAGLGLGGSLDNVVVVDGAQIMNEGGLRFDDEFVRHKILDCVGDLYLAGGPMLGRVVAHKSGHAFNNKLLRALFTQPEAWEWVSLTEGHVSARHANEPLAATA